MASGEIATNPEAAVAAAEAGRAAILVRAETSPDDVHGMARAAGILTLARRSGEPRRGRRTRVGHPGRGRRRRLEVATARSWSAAASSMPATSITIDGDTGEVFEGAVAGATEVVPEAEDAARLGSGARDRDRRRSTAWPEASATPANGSAVTPDACIRAIGVKGFAQPQGVADVVLATPEDVQPVLDALVADGLVAPSAGAFRLTEAGSSRAAAAPRRGAGRMGTRQRRGGIRRVPRARPADEGHRDRLADARRGGRRRQRPHRRRLRRRRPRTAGRAP